MSEAFRAISPLPGLGSEHKQALETIIAPCFLKGDVLLAIQCTQLELMPDHEQVACLARVAKLVDSISNVWTQYDEMAEPELGAVVVCAQPLSSVHGLSATPWPLCDPVASLRPRGPQRACAERRSLHVVPLRRSCSRATKSPSSPSTGAATTSWHTR